MLPEGPEAGLHPHVPKDGRLQDIKTNFINYIRCFGVFLEQQQKMNIWSWVWAPLSEHSIQSKAWTQS